MLNLQLESQGKTYRDYYVDLDFTGRRTLVVHEPTTERMLPEFRPHYANYAFKAAMYDFDYAGIVGLNVRWMRLPAGPPLRCTARAGRGPGGDRTAAEPAADRRWAARGWSSPPSFAPAITPNTGPTVRCGCSTATACFCGALCRPATCYGLPPAQTVSRWGASRRPRRV